MILSLLGLAGRVESAQPVWLTGSLSYSVEQRDAERAISRTTEAGSNDRLSLDINARTYIWQPWFALIDAGVIISEFDYENQVDSTAESGSSDQTDSSESLNSSLKLRVFPQSQFPFEAYYQNSDTRTASLIDQDGVLGEGRVQFLDDFAITRYGVNQQYFTKDGLRLSARLEQVDVEDSKSTDSGTFFELTSGAILGHHKLNSSFKYDLVSRTSIDPKRFASEEESDTMFLDLQHRYAPRKANKLTVRNNLTWEDRKTQRELGQTSDRQLLQFNNYSNWNRDPAGRTRYTTNAQLQSNESVSRSDRAITDSLSLNFGVVHEFTPVFQGTAAVGGSSRYFTSDSLPDVKQSGSREDSSSTYETLGVRYRPLDKSFGQYLYNWSASATGRLDQDTRGDSTTLSAGLGHSLNRRLGLGRTRSLNLSANQALSPLRRTGESPEDDEEVMLLNQQLALRYDQSSGRGNMYTSLTYNDSRDFGDDEFNYKGLSLQFSGNLNIDRNSSFGGSLTWRMTEDESQLRDEPDDTRTSNNRNISANLNYRHRRAFGINRLRFRSVLSLNDRRAEFDERGLDELLSEKRVVQNSWENRFDYRIGLLSLTLIGRWNEYEEDSDKTILFKVSRHFSGVL